MHSLAALGLAAAGCASIKPPKGVQPRVLTMQTTAYCSCRTCCNWKRNWYFRPVIASGPNKGKPKDVGVTASGTDVTPRDDRGGHHLVPVRHGHVRTGLRLRPRRRSRRRDQGLSHRSLVRRPRRRARVGIEKAEGAGWMR